jgi:hypothetical protein
VSAHLLVFVFFFCLSFFSRPFALLRLGAFALIVLFFAEFREGGSDKVLTIFRHDGRKA